MSTYIVHVDGDSFFVSCEQMRNPALRGKPVVTGGERSIATAMSKEAKALGVARGTPTYLIRRLFPSVVIVASDYSFYKQCARRMYAIVRRHADVVEEYSIDECFALITDPKVAHKIKEELEAELGLTFGVGVATTKTLAKVASKASKPAGLVEIVEGVPTESYQRNRADLLGVTPVDAVWGIGRGMAEFLRARECATALDFVTSGEWWVKQALAKPYRDTWRELCGIRVDTVVPRSEAGPQDSISSTESFERPTKNPSLLLAELSRHCEDVCERLREMGHRARDVHFFIKTRTFHYRSYAVSLSSPSDSPSVLLRAIRSSFDRVFEADVEYRAAGVTVRALSSVSTSQPDLFGEHTSTDRQAAAFAAVDRLNHRWGGVTIRLASTVAGDVPELRRARRQLRPFADLPMFSLPYLGEVR